MDARGFIRELMADRRYRGQIVHVREIAARPAQFAAPGATVDEAIWSTLRRMNIHQLYTHQAAAVDAALGGKDLVIVTGTASGKTLCYNLPVVQTLLGNPDARALYLFPTKALAHDQLGTLQRLTKSEEQALGQRGLGDVLKPAVYDGDTPAHNRTKIRSDASVILTNPDMLHVGILPYHAKWHSFLRNLQYIVVDELHTYRGIFGSHVAGVLRRLLRLCEHYGSRPQVICCSATIANPVELAGKLTGRGMALIDNDGSPRGRKYFVLWNPPLLDDGLSRRSANVEAMELLVDLVRRRTQTIVFGKARIVTELLYKYACEALAGEGDLASRIRPYRGGYLANERREIEHALFSGHLLAVAATNALELGIDIGALDAAILVGFPNTICSTWQQAGRAGRTSQDSLVFLVGYNEPIDQYLMRHPEYLFGASHEHSVIDPQNPHILGSQLSCACFEKPLTADDERYFGPLVTHIADILAEEGQAKPIDGRYYWRTSEFPQKGVNLRLVSTDTFAIVDVTGKTGPDAGGNAAASAVAAKSEDIPDSPSGNLPREYQQAQKAPRPEEHGKVIGNVDAISAVELVYPNAIYLHEGRSFLVKKLDMEARLAFVEPAVVDYYTQPVLANSCRLFEPAERKPYAQGEMFYGPAEVTWQTTAFRKVKYYTMELVGQADLDLPAQNLPTTAMWYVPPEAMRNGLKAAGFNPIEAMIGVRNLMLSSLPTLAMCDRRDISGMIDHANLGQPTIVIYDRYTGGLGFSQRGYELIDDWLEMCKLIVLDCPCVEGCPSCVGLANLRPPIHHDPDLSSGYAVPNKEATIVMLQMMKAANSDIAT